MARLGEAQRGRWGFCAALVFGVGAHVGIEGSAPALPIALGLAVGLGGLALWRRAAALREGGHGRTIAYAACLLCAAFACGLLAASARLAATDRALIQWPDGPVGVEGRIERVETRTADQRVTLALSAVRGADLGERSVRVRLSMRGGEALSAGGYVSCLAILSPPSGPSTPFGYDFARRAWFEGLDGVGFSLGACDVRPIAPVLSAGEAARRAVSVFRAEQAARIAEAAPGRAGLVAAALMTGERAAIPEATNDALRRSGLAHLLAISGLHMGLASGVFFVLVWRGLALWPAAVVHWPVRKIAAVAAIIAATGYVVISGASVPTLRAWIMTVIVLLGVIFDRNAFSVASLAVAFAVIVALSPESAGEPGLLMSFCATAVLIAGYESWRDRPKRSHDTSFAGKARRAFAGLAATSIMAGAATGPVAAAYFQTNATYGVIANLAAMPVFTFISAPLGVVAALASPTPLGDLAVRTFALSLEPVLWIADQAASAPGAVRRIGPGDPLAVYGFALSVGAAVILAGWVRAGFAVAATAFALAILVRPVPDLILTAQGDVYVRTEANWARLGPKRDLPPLMLDDPIRVARSGVAEVGGWSVRPLEGGGATFSASPGSLEVPEETGAVKHSVPSLRGPSRTPSSRSCKTRLTPDAGGQIVLDARHAALCTGAFVYLAPDAVRLFGEPAHPKPWRP